MVTIDLFVPVLGELSSKLLERVSGKISERVLFKTGLSEGLATKKEPDVPKMGAFVSLCWLCSWQ